MKQLRAIVLTLWWRPLTWIFYCFFQPMRFKRVVEINHMPTRFMRMCRLVIPLFFCAFPFAFITHSLFILLFPHIFGDATTSIERQAFDETWVMLLMLMIAVLVGTLFGMVYGIAGGMAAAYWSGAVASINLSGPTTVLLVLCLVAGVAGLTVGVTIGGASDVMLRSRAENDIGSAMGLLLGIPPGILLGIVAGNLGSSAVQWWLPDKNIYRGIVASVGSAILGSILAILFIAAFQSVLRGSVRGQQFRPGIERGLRVGTIVCLVASIIVSLTLGTALGNDIRATFITGLTYIGSKLLVAPVFFVAYMLGYYRLPLYPVSVVSSLLTYLVSRKHPERVFSALRHSSLYWDECVFLPLLGLKRTLYLALEQDHQQIIDCIAFIVTERITQINAAREVATEMALRDLEGRSTLAQIAQASARLAEILPQEARLIDPLWATPFVRFEDASREAARYGTLLSRQAKKDALDEMLLNLKRVPSRVFHDQKLDERLRKITQQWTAAAQQELERIALAPEEFGFIENPYISGAALKTRSQQFVGRQDLVRRLEHALRRGVDRPCFFLAGERRMGKTSVLNQLPILLGTRYITLIFDLQARGLSANIAVFLSEIARVTCQALEGQGIHAPELLYDILNEARRENEAMVYYHFNQWLMQIEAILEREDRILLITFDEFEKFEEAGQARFLDLQLLLDWFRNVIQHHPRLALLFSGVKTPGEMETWWAGHFVNVKTLRVSFLHPTEARRLILSPVPGYPGDTFFPPAVVDEIIRVTGCHPFLVQAICSELIDTINADMRAQGRLEDVEVALENVLESWGETYFRDLWERTDQEQRICLHALRCLEKATLAQLCVQCNMEEHIIYNTLQTLCRRDLVRFEHEEYQIATPILAAWLTRYSYP